MLTHGLVNSVAAIEMGLSLVLLSLTEDDDL